ncbi:uncharacterized protein LOC142239104 [Haematobia irritans]|uniref:uncharacterized protein LOC142239104 n=1 Tax=Haematobia irritans TaxID=7368 RepID=UPI003F508B2F
MWPTTNSQQLIPSLLVIFIAQSCMADRHKYFFDYEDLFAPCEDVPSETGDIHDVFDLTNFTMSYHEGDIHITGNVTCVWKDLDPDDRIEIRMQLYKLVRGKWQPTVLSAFIPDFCEDLFNKGSLTNQFWGQHILEEDRECNTNYGHIYRHRPFLVDTEFEFSVNMEGRYNVIITFVAFSKYNVKRPKNMCASVRGEFVKI